MYGNIRHAIQQIVKAYESATSASSIEADVEESFSHFELSTLNESLNKFSYSELLHYAQHIDAPELSELSAEFFETVHLAL